MKSLFLLLILPLIVALLAVNPSATIIKKSTESIGCGPAPDYSNTSSGTRFMIALPGWGSYSYKITTTNDSAQYFFNQGLSMYYSYHSREANASFREAARFDSTSAMVYWGQALTMGPTYNFGHMYVMSQAIYDVLKKMNANSENLTSREKDLVLAMNARYPDAGNNIDRKMLNRAYASQMQQLVSKHPDDLDIAALYIDAIMLEHPWNFWNNDGTPKEWTPEVVSLAEKVLKANDSHPGVLHYYIHLTEASRNPQRAVKSADILKDLLPGVAHMVHMSSHVYERNGSYAKGVEVNEKADQDLMMYDSIVRGLNISLRPHVTHYFAVQTYCALTGGMYKKGLPLAERCKKSTAPSYENTDDQYTYMFPEFTMVRMGKWKDLLAHSKAPDKRWPYASILYHFSTGLAYLHTGKLSEARTSLTNLKTYIDDPILKKVNLPLNSTYPPSVIAMNLLEGSILFEENKYEEAIKLFKKAIQEEDQLLYSEPKDWLIPSRQFLGAYLMKLKRFKEAEKNYREDLEWNPGNGWSLVGLHNSLVAQGKSREAEPLKQEYMKSFSEADKIPPGSVYLKEE